MLFGGARLFLRTIFLEMLLNENLLAHVVEMGKFLLKNLKKLKEKYPALIRDARGIGLMAGLEFDESVSSADICTAVRKNGLLTAAAGGNVLRFVPPLIIQPADIEEGTAILDKTITEFA